VLDCTAALADPPQLSPPNHKFVDVSIVGVTDPDGDPVTITVTGITQDESIGSEDGGNPCPDAAGVGSSTARLRAERSASGDGRVYHVAFLADDGRGSQCNGTVTVCVPKSRKPGASCVDQGPLYDSVVGTCVPVQCDDICTLELAAGSECAGEKLPHGLNRRIERARLLLARAADVTSDRAAARLVKSATESLKKAARMAASAEQTGTISSACRHTLEEMADNARAPLARELREP